MNKLASILVILCCMTIPASAATLINRYDYSSGGESQTLALIGTNIDLWVFNADNPAKTDIEIGKEFPVGRDLKAGGYFGSIPDKSELYIIPSACYKAKVLGGTLSAHLGIYLPLNGGNVNIYSRETSLTYKLVENLEVGLAATYGHIEGKPEVIQIGLMAKATMGDASLKFRYLAPGNGAPQKFRFETCLPISF